MSEPVLSTRETADRLGVTTRTVQRWISAGLLPGSYPTNPHAKRPNYRIPLAAVEAFEAERSHASPGRNGQ